MPLPKFSDHLASLAQACSLRQLQVRPELRAAHRYAECRNSGCVPYPRDGGGEDTASFTFIRDHFTRFHPEHRGALDRLNADWDLNDERLAALKDAALRHIKGSGR